MNNKLLAAVCCLFLVFAVSIAVAQEGGAPAAEQPPAAMEQPATAPAAEQPPAAMEQPTTAPAAEQPAAAPEKAPAAKSMAVDAGKVKAVQEALNKAGAHLKVDGMMGKKTRKALKKFQKRNDLKVTGKLDAETLGKLGIQ
jgi:peptidoglycan hydrolase-like protein with peptidoglycan-binding domain